MKTHVIVGPTKERPYHLYDDERVSPGWPHGDAWGRMRGFPESHDTERHRKLLEEIAKKKKDKKT